METLRIASIMSLVTLLLVSQPAAGEPALVLHALDGASRSCSSSEVSGFRCGSANVQAASTRATDVVLAVHQVDDIAGIQLRYDWPADWSYQSWQSGCVSNALAAVQPQADSGDLVFAFDPITGSSGTAVLGLLTVFTGGSGCLMVGDSAYPSGTHFVDSTASGHPLAADRRGKVCVGAGGVDACNLGTALEARSWAVIKDGYRR